MLTREAFLCPRKETEGSLGATNPPGPLVRRAPWVPLTRQGPWCGGLWDTLHSHASRTLGRTAWGAAAGAEPWPLRAGLRTAACRAQWSQQAS